MVWGFPRAGNRKSPHWGTLLPLFLPKADKTAAIWAISKSREGGLRLQVEPIDQASAAIDQLVAAQGP